MQYNRIKLMMDADTHLSDQERTNLTRWRRRQLAFKTELCQAAKTPQGCVFGSECRFAHNTDELRVRHQHPKYKTELCRNFELGNCTYGRHCQFIHRYKGQNQEYILKKRDEDRNGINMNEISNHSSKMLVDLTSNAQVRSESSISTSNVSVLSHSSSSYTTSDTQTISPKPLRDVVLTPTANSSLTATSNENTTISGEAKQQQLLTMTTPIRKPQNRAGESAAKKQKQYNEKRFFGGGKTPQYQPRNSRPTNVQLPKTVKNVTQLPTPLLQQPQIPMQTFNGGTYYVAAPGFGGYPIPVDNSIFASLTNYNGYYPAAGANFAPIVGASNLSQFALPPAVVNTNGSVFQSASNIMPMNTQFYQQPLQQFYQPQSQQVPISQLTTTIGIGVEEKPQDQAITIAPPPGFMPNVVVSNGFRQQTALPNTAFPPPQISANASVNVQQFALPPAIVNTVGSAYQADASVIPMTTQFYQQ